jgi:hypothetical protein
LLFGPAPIIAASLGLARWIKPDEFTRAEGNHVVQAADFWPSPLPARAAERAHHDSALAQSCRFVAEHLRERLSADCHVVEFAPFVLAGDLSEDQLTEWYKSTIGPASRAMAHSFFRVVPHEPITVLLFSGEHSYDRYAHELYGDEQISIYGYYKRGQRVLVMNAATGAGTIVHELTHALADFDCPHIPDWFNEGLASLHEQCRIRPNETGIDGLENWRLPILQRAIQQKRLRSLEALIMADDFRMHDIGLNYAQARYLCLWLQRRGLLEEFFERWRANQSIDPLGGDALLSLFPGQTWGEIDREFQNWVAALAWQPNVASTASRTTP